MLDINYIRENPDKVKKAAQDKGVEVNIDKLLELDGKIKHSLRKEEELRAERNELADSMKSEKPTAEKIERGKQLKDELAELEKNIGPVRQEFEELLYKAPNVPSDDTPVGDSEDQNEILDTVGEKPQFDFEPKPHWEMTNFVDEERATRISGARFSFLKNGLVLLQFALIQYGLSVLTNEETLKEIADEAGLDVSTKPFIPMLPPTMMRTDAYKATGRLKPEEVTFKLATDDLWLTGSSEHSMSAYYLGETLDEQELPIRFAGYNTAYRREVGSAGKDTRGILRQHQFDKLEMESFTKPENSRVEHEFMIAIQKYLNNQLELPYQVILKCTFDMGGPNIRGVDIETWMSGQNAYRETHTADYIGDYQARGLGTKFKSAEGNREFVHTNDATAFAQRTLIAIMENNQTAEGRIIVPEVLRPFMGGQSQI